MIHPAEFPLSICQELRGLTAWLDHLTPEALEDVLATVSGATSWIPNLDPARAVFVAYRELVQARLDQRLSP